MRRRIRVQVGQRYFQDFAHGSHNQIWGWRRSIRRAKGFHMHAWSMLTTHQGPRRCHAARWTGQHSFRLLNA